MADFAQPLSPVERVTDPLFDDKELQVFIKRDDMIHPFISGNKWRKLKYILRDAREKGQDHLVTFGGAYSNHLLATAAASAKFGFKSTGFVRGEEVENDTLFLCRLHGMHLIKVSRDAYRNRPALFDTHFGEDSDAYFIDEGGASALAAKGCAELVTELPQVYDHIFCAAGTGTTCAGLLNGLAGLPATLHVVSALKGGDFLLNDMGRYTTRTTDCELHTGYHFGGYAKTTPALIGFVESFVQRTGIMIEPIYTGKMMYALYDQVKQNRFKPGSTVLAIHTGGLMGLTGLRQKFM